MADRAGQEQAERGEQCRALPSRDGEAWLGWGQGVARTGRGGGRECF